MLSITSAKAKGRLYHFWLLASKYLYRLVHVPLVEWSAATQAKLPAFAGDRCVSLMQPLQEQREKQMEAIKTATATPVADVVALCPCPEVPHQPFSGKVVKPVVCRAVENSRYIKLLFQEEDCQKT